MEGLCGRDWRGHALRATPATMPLDVLGLGCKLRLLELFGTLYRFMSFIWRSSITYMNILAATVAGAACSWARCRARPVSYVDPPIHRTGARAFLFLNGVPKNRRTNPPALGSRAVRCS